MTQYGVAVLVKGMTLNGELRLVLNHLWASESTIRCDAVHYSAAPEFSLPGFSVLDGFSV
jgi:hypothetical protein